MKICCAYARELELSGRKTLYRTSINFGTGIRCDKYGQFIWKITHKKINCLQFF